MVRSLGFRTEAPRGSYYGSWSRPTHGVDDESRFTVKWLGESDFLFVLGKKTDTEWRKGPVTGTFKTQGLGQLAAAMTEWSAHYTNSPANQASSYLYVHLGQFASFVLPPEAHLRLSPALCHTVGTELAGYIQKVARGEETPMPGFVDGQIFPSSN